MKVPHTRFLVRQYVQFNLRMRCTLFYPGTAFPTRFSNEVFNKACAYHDNCPRESDVKHMDSNLEEKEEEF
jgi:hypothetical protein